MGFIIQSNNCKAMIKKNSLSFILLLTALISNCQDGDEYQVYALKYYGTWNTPAQEIAVGANAKDSVQGCHMVWLLKGENGRNILVDAGWIDTSKTGIRNYVRPDLVLQRINVYPSDWKSR